LRIAVGRAKANWARRRLVFNVRSKWAELQWKGQILNPLVGMTMSSLQDRGDV
jgi:hypothetical protein